MNSYVVFLFTGILLCSEMMYLSICNHHFLQHVHDIQEVENMFEAVKIPPEDFHILSQKIHRT